MNPLAALIASLTGTAATNGPGAGTAGGQEPGLFAQLLNGTAEEGQPLLAVLGGQQDGASLPGIQSPDNPSAPLISLPLPGESAPQSVNPAHALLGDAVADGKSAPVAAQTPTPLAVTGEDTAPLASAPALDPGERENSGSDETENSSTGELTLLAGANSTVAKDNPAPSTLAAPAPQTPQQPPELQASAPNAAQQSSAAPAASPAPAPASAPSVQTAPAPVIPEAGTAPQQTAANSAPAAAPRSPAEAGQRIEREPQADSGAKRAENSEAGAPRSERTQAAQIVRTTVNPVTGQTLLHVAERNSGDGQTSSSLDAGINAVQLRAGAPAQGAAAAQPGTPQATQVPLNNLAVHIAQQARNGVNRFDIRLDPPELGRLEIRLDVTREGQVTTHMVVERTETLDLLQRDSRGLERALQEAGLDTSKGGLSFSLKGQGQQNSASTDGSASQAARAGEDGDEQAGDGEADETAQQSHLYTASGGLDIRI
jgi:flagellar hook-length control protein FliK